MVHKKYIKKGGKVFGPYLYENYRVNGITKTRYLGKGKKDKIKKKLQVNYNFFLIILFIFLIAITGIYLLSQFVFFEGEKDFEGRLGSEKFFDVFLNVTGNSAPFITGIPDEILVCENEKLNHIFNITDNEGDRLEIRVFPGRQNDISFFVFPDHSLEGHIVTGVELLTLREFFKKDIDNKRINGRGWGIYTERISADDGISVGYADFNVSIIEINNAPEVQNIGARTVWTRGENSFFNYNINASDKEDGNSNDGWLNFSLYFLNSERLFEISKNGLMYFIPKPEQVGFYNLRVCVNDSGLRGKEIHKNISLCWNKGFYADPAMICKEFSLTITNENRKPVIISHYPENYSFNINGNANLYFNLTSYDPDGNIPDVYWYVDNNLVRYIQNESFDEFKYSFGCDVSGNHNVKGFITDGELNDSVEWNFSVAGVPCPIPSLGGSGGGSGEGRIIFCTEKWVCEEWLMCENLEDSSESMRINPYYYSLIKERCNVSGYKEDKCGFQIRECFESNKCRTNSSKPGSIRECFYSKNPKCSDEIKNCHDDGCEDLVDCGGPCPACPTCTDKIKNQGEEDIDCGGPCKKCAEFPIKPKFLNLAVSYSLIILVILVFVLIFNEIRKKIFFEKIFEMRKIGRRDPVELVIADGEKKGKKIGFVRRERIEKLKPGSFFYSNGKNYQFLNRKGNQAYIKENLKKSRVNYTLFAFISFAFIFLALFGGFVLSIASQDRIILKEGEPGFLGSAGLANIFVKNLANIFGVNVIQAVSSSSENTNLLIWDDSDDSEKGNKYSYCREYCTEKRKSEQDWNVYFYANYTENNLAITPSNGNGLCYIKFSDSLNWSPMIFDYNSLIWNYNRSFNYKNRNEFNINCTSIYNNLDILSEVLIKNTEPYIITDPEGYIRYDLKCIEDNECIYDFKTNISEDDLNDFLSYGYYSSNTTLANFSIESDTGILFVNISESKYTGNGKKVELNVRDSESPTKAALLKVDIQEVNDAPVFLNLEDKNFNMSEEFQYVIYIQDEEDNKPFEINISFVSCSNAEWSDRKSTNCSLFDYYQYFFDKYNGVLNISFVPSENDVGSYIINFSVKDNNSQLGDAAGSMIVNFAVLIINKPPVFNYVCDNERKASEDLEFSCWINATDVYETNYLSFISDFKWFLNEKTDICNLSTRYKSGVRVNFSANDSSVGNWSINISVKDTGSPIKSNSTLIWFFVENKNDSVYLSEITHEKIINNVFNAYVGNNYEIEVNASDDDLFIPSSNYTAVYQEDLIFSAKDSNNQKISWINIRNGEKIKNNKKTYLQFSTNSGNTGNHLVNLSVRDKNNYSLDSKVFFINITGNHAPEWKEPLQTVFVIYEDNLSLWDFSKNVSDLENDEINFSFTSDSNFPSFNLNSKGIINFPALDSDVGQHLVEITASDGKTPSKRIFNFSIYNTNDNLFIRKPIQQSHLINATLDSNFNLIIQEDSSVSISIFAEDDDFKIPLNQRNFYDEELNLSLKIEGKNNNLFGFIKDDNFPVPGGNLTQYNAFFSPRKSDLGDYNITINISDKNKMSDVLRFNITIVSVQHAPVLMNFSNYSAKINGEFYLNIEASDLEDINDSSGKMKYSYFFIEGSDFINNYEEVFNSTSGEINYNFNKTGRYHIGISLLDSEGLNDSGDFWIFVYDNPVINYPGADCRQNLKENFSSNLSVRANHSIGDSLKYEIYLNNYLKESFINYGDNRNLIFNFTPNFTDESYGDFSKNISFFVYNPFYRELNSSVRCSANISHTNSPVVFNGFIGDKSTTYNNEIAIDLKDYFSDIDHEDLYYNEGVDFKISSKNISSRIDSNWILYLSSSGAVKEIMNIFGKDSESNATSNNFIIEFTIPPIEYIPSPSSSGGGGGSSNIIHLKIIHPEKVSAFRNQKINIPLMLENKGSVGFNNLKLASSVLKDGKVSYNVKSLLSKESFEKLEPNAKESLTLSVVFNEESNLGNYDVFVNVSSQFPVYTDWGKININLQRINESSVKELMVFTEELITENPVCIEIKEILNEAKIFQEKGELEKAKIKAEEAINSCQKSISQVNIPRLRKNPYLMALFLFIAILLGLILGMGYYFLKRRKIQKFNAEEKEKQSL